jgi:hypothetical protein
MGCIIIEYICDKKGKGKRRNQEKKNESNRNEMKRARGHSGRVQKKK